MIWFSNKSLSPIAFQNELRLRTEVPQYVSELTCADSDALSLKQERTADGPLVLRGGGERPPRRGWRVSWGKGTVLLSSYHVPGVVQMQLQLLLTTVL